MTDRINMLYVTLETDLRDDDATPLIDAISQLRGVLHVTTRVVEPRDHVALQRARHELTGKIWDALGVSR